MDYVARHLQPRIVRALDSFRVVVVHGPRQCGKTTLARLVAETLGGSYISLDDRRALQAAESDPLRFLSSRSFPLVVDEIQRGGDHLVRMIKQLVDENPARGRFLLSGSSNFLTVPTISESLAGRARILRLWPLSEAELAGAPSTVVDGWFDEPEVRADAGPATQLGLSHRRDYLDRVCRSGYPEAISLPPEEREGWFESYVETVTQRDLPALADIRKVSALPRLMRWVSDASSTEINLSSAAKKLGIGRETVTSYLEWLRMVFLLSEAPSWTRNLTAREVRSPKLHVTDSGLAAAQLGLTADHLDSPNATGTGRLLESFVFNEITRQASAASGRLNVFHYRDGRHEIDLVLEGPGGSLIAIEVKATSSPDPGRLRPMAWLRDRIDAVEPGAFRAGYLLHTGRQTFTVGDRLHLRPISDLWTPRPPDQLAWT